MFKFLLAFIIWYTATECGDIKHNNACDSLNDCDRIDPGCLGRIKDDASYDLFCQNISNFTSCYKAVTEQCDNETVVDVVKGRFLVSQYLCSVARKIDILALARSKCVNNSTKYKEVERDIDGCRSSFEDQMKSTTNGVPSLTMCQLVDQLKVCTIFNYTKNCNNQVGGLMFELWDVIFGPEFEPFNC